MGADPPVAELGFRQSGDEAFSGLPRTGQIRLWQQNSELLASKPQSASDEFAFNIDEIGGSQMAATRFQNR